jgi:hypothetical protein
VFLRTGITKHDIDFSRLQRSRITFVIDTYDQLFRLCHFFDSQSRCFILYSLRPIPDALYQCTSAEWIVPSASRTRAIPLAFAPTAPPVDFTQPGDFANARARGEGLNAGNFVQNLEAHRVIASPSRDSLNVGRSVFLAAHDREGTADSVERLMGTKAEARFAFISDKAEFASDDLLEV